MMNQYFSPLKTSIEKNSVFQILIPVLQMPWTIWNCVTNLELAVEWASKRTHVIVFMTDTNIKKLKCSAVPRFARLRHQLKKKQCFPNIDSCITDALDNLELRDQSGTSC